MHEQFLLQALDEAFRGKATSFPNPAVGAILVCGREVIGRGYHIRAGTEHAEVHALSGFEHVPQDAVLYVTLEPCCHVGRTPPCTDLIVKKGVKRVVFAMPDPNPRVNGGGAAELMRHGVAVTELAVPVITDFYKSYRFWTAKQRPYVTAKIASTLDGIISGPAGERLQISSEGLATVTHTERRNHSAFLTTARTISADDPLLTVRSEAGSETRALYIIDSRLSTPASAKIWTTGAPITVFHGPNLETSLRQRFESQGARLIEVPADGGRLSLSAVFCAITDDGLHDLWIEAGGTLLESLLMEDYLDRLLWYTSPSFGPPGGGRALPVGLLDQEQRQKPATTVRCVGNEAIFELTWERGPWKN